MMLQGKRCLSPAVQSCSLALERFARRMFLRYLLSEK